jgi:hypothetical protein
MKRTCAILLPAVVLAVAITPDFSNAQDTGYAVTERGPDYAVHQKTVVEHGTNRVHQYTELATGLNYTNSYGQLVESREEIDILPNGSAAATQGRHKAYFPGNIYQGEIEVVTPDGLHLKSRPLAISYDDGTNTVLIGVLTNSAGVLAASNQVVYPNAFAGLNADLRYTYRKGGFEQDVVLNEQPPAPETFGLNSQYTHLQVLTEFFNPPEPKQVRAKASAKAGLTDTTLTFGQMKMVQGKAFSIPHPASGHPLPSDGRGKGEGKVSVSKSWVKLQGRTFLIEELPVSSIAAQLQQLPAPAAVSVSSANPLLHKVSATRLLPPIQVAVAGARPVQLVRADLHYNSGVVLDYDEVDDDQTDFTFEGGVTYYISGYVNLDGTTTFEGGTMLKFPEDGSGALAINNNMVFNSSAYHPAIFTSANDDSVGETISGSSGSPAMSVNFYTYLWTQSWTNGDVYISHARFLYAGNAIGTDDFEVQHINDVQFIQCGFCVLNGPCAGTFMNNVLASGGYYVADCGSLAGNNVTVDSPAWGIIYDGGLCFTNCVLVNVTNLAWDGGSSWPDWSITDVSADYEMDGDHNGFYNSPAFGASQITDGSYPFQTSGGGNYYLADNTFRGAGTTNIDPGLLAEIRQMTTYPPSSLASDFSASATLYPCVPRDTALAPDVGYHYDPVDYQGGSLTVESGATLTLTNGAVVAVTSGSETVNGTLTAGQQITNAQVQEAQSSPLDVYVGGNAAAAYTDVDGDGLPDWWEEMYFGTNGLNSNDSFDGQGNSLLYDYMNGIDPNIPAFILTTTSLYVNQTNVSAQVNLTAGLPGYYAVLVNDTNLADASWQHYTSSNLTVNLGSTDGVYSVWVGLRGSPTNATQTWDTDDLLFTLDRTAPKVVITQQSGGTVKTPYLQLLGYADKQLGSLCYGISNAAGMVTNQPGYVTDQFFDTNKFDYTTNWFQCYDVPLTNGVNNLTVHVTDRSGNTTTTNFNVTLDYSTATNPVVGLTWPTNGMQICGSSFTLRGTVDDPSATVSATITDTNGDTNTVSGEVERSGVLWVENLPLNSGTNWVTLNVTNAAGLSSETNVTVVQSAMSISVSSISGDLWVPPVTVYGNISDATAAVCVNGVAGTNYGNGTWEADNVPVSSSGVASFDISAGSGDGDPDYNTNVIKDAEVLLVGYNDGKTENITNSTWNYNYSRTKNFGAVYQTNSGGQVFLQSYSGGTEDMVAYSYPGDPLDDGGYADAYNWSSTNAGVFYDHFTDSEGDDIEYTNSISSDGDGVTWTPDTDLYQFGGDGGAVPGQVISHYFANKVHEAWVNSAGTGVDLRVDARTKMKLFTGGKAGIGHMNLIQLHCSGVEYDAPDTNAPVLDGGDPFFAPWLNVEATPVPSSSLRALGQWVGADGNLWVAEPDGASLDLLLNAPARHYYATATPTKYKLTITANGVPLDPDTVAPGADNCVGQDVTFALNGIPGGVGETNQWILGGIFYNDESNSVPGETYPTCSITYYVNTEKLTNNPTTAWWVSGNFDPPDVYPAVVNCTLFFYNGQAPLTIGASGLFNMYRPQATVTTTTGTVAVDNNIEYTPTGFALHYGDPTYSGIHGITFSGSVTMPNQFSGDLSWLQVLNTASASVQDNDGSWLITITNCSDVLDEDGDPYPSISDSPPSTADSPGQEAIPFLDQTILDKMDASMWLMFTPYDGHRVPLNRTDWHWSGTAVKSGTVWNLTPPPNNNPYPRGVDTEDYPAWINNVTNFEHHNN